MLSSERREPASILLVHGRQCIRGRIIGRRKKAWALPSRTNGQILLDMPALFTVAAALYRWLILFWFNLHDEGKDEMCTYDAWGRGRQAKKSPFMAACRFHIFLMRTRFSRWAGMTL